MKIRTAKYIIKEGILNSYKNKLMSLASISIVAASLIIFGMFLLITLNLNHIMGKLGEQPEIEVFCKPELDDFQVASIEKNIKSNPKIREYKMVTKKEAFERAKELLGEDKQALEGEDESFLPVSFVIKLRTLNDSRDIADEFRKMVGISKVRYSQEEIDFITKISHWVRLVSGFLLAVLLAISVFIISNTIKLTVFARRKEINIMKYIGATDWFIRWPFVIEGVIIGLAGAIAAFVLLGYGYNTLESKINTEFFRVGSEAITAIKINEFGLKVVAIYCIVGVSVGALGSLLSIRKYLHV